MRLGDYVYFAPGIRFAELDLGGRRLPEQFERRIAGYYLDPALDCCDCGHAFAAGLVIVACIDALARLQYGGEVGMRFKRFLKEELSSFTDERVAERFYDQFRNGLVHEARVKKGGQFSLEQSETVVVDGSILSINPRLLANEVRAALKRYVALLVADDSARLELAQVLKREFLEELADFEVQQRAT